MLNTEKKIAERTSNIVLAGFLKGGIIGALFMAFVLFSDIFLPSTHASPWVRAIVVLVGLLAGATVGLLFGLIGRHLRNRSATPRGRRIFALASASVVFLYLIWSLEFASNGNVPGILAALACAVLTGATTQQELSR